MSDTVSRDAVLHALQEWTYCCDVEDVVRALPAVQPDLADPNVVHANMLRGTIAKPTLKQIKHIYGDAVQIKMTMQDEAEAQLRWIAAVQPHVNETPKSEHDARDVLTTAKGDA